MQMSNTVRCGYER